MLLTTFTYPEPLYYADTCCVLSSPIVLSVLLLSKIEYKRQKNCSFFDWRHTIKLILCLACLLNINCSSLQLIKKGPTVYHICPTLIMFTNHTHSPNSTVTLRTSYTHHHLLYLSPKYNRTILDYHANNQRCTFCFLTFLQPPVVHRYAVIGSHLFHSHLSMLYHNVFFMICKALGIGFNIKVKTVTINLFTLSIIIMPCSSSATYSTV